MCPGASGHQGHYGRRASLPSVKHWALARGGAAPPFEPPRIPRRCRGSRRTGASTTTVRRSAMSAPARGRQAPVQFWEYRWYAARTISSANFPRNEYWRVPAQFSSHIASLAIQLFQKNAPCRTPG